MKTAYFSVLWYNVATKHAKTAKEIYAMVTTLSQRVAEAQEANNVMPEN
jgi:hypothetical protein